MGAGAYPGLARRPYRHRPLRLGLAHRAGLGQTADARPMQFNMGCFACQSNYAWTAKMLEPQLLWCSARTRPPDSSIVAPAVGARMPRATAVGGFQFTEPYRRWQNPASKKRPCSRGTTSGMARCGRSSRMLPSRGNLGHGRRGGGDGGSGRARQPRRHGFSAVFIRERTWAPLTSNGYSVWEASHPAVVTIAAAAVISTGMDNGNQAHGGHRYSWSRRLFGQAGGYELPPDWPLRSANGCLWLFSHIRRARIKSRRAVGQLSIGQCDISG